MPNIIYPNKGILDALLRSFSAEVGFSFEKKGYVAPTVFLMKGKQYGSGMSYYSSLSDAFDRLKYIFHQGGRNVSSVGYVPLKKDGTAQTIGINVDFYFAVNPLAVVNLGYAARRFASSQPDRIYSIIRFYKTDGSGPYYAIYDPNYFGAAATPVSSYSSDKIAAMDKFSREAALLKAKHNTLATYLTQLSAKQLTPVHQQIFNEGSLRLQTMRAEMAQIEGLEVYYSKDGAIGIIALPLIGWVIVGAVVAGWAVSRIIEQYQKTARVNSSYDVQKWVSDQKVKIAQEVVAGRISQASANELNNELNQVSKKAGENAETASQNNSMFGDVAEVLKWGAIVFIAAKVLPMLGKSNNSGR